MSFLIDARARTNYITIMEALQPPHPDWRTGTAPGARPIRRLHLLQLLVQLEPRLIVNRELCYATTGGNELVLRLCCLPSQRDAVAQKSRSWFDRTPQLTTHGPYGCVQYTWETLPTLKDAEKLATMFTSSAATEFVIL